MTSHSASATSVMAPSFATVTLVFTGETAPTDAFLSRPPTSTATTEPKTMRVPITAHTTVRELAKGAMSRFLSSLRRTASTSNAAARQLCRTGIVVTDVHLLSPSNTTAMRSVLGNTPSTGESHKDARGAFTQQQQYLQECKIELFSDDCVLQVVQVREEIVYMHVKAATARPTKRKPTADRETAVLEESATTGLDTTDASSPASPAVNPTWSIVPLDQSMTTGLTTDDEVLVDVHGEFSKGDISMSVPLPPQRQESTVRITALTSEGAQKTAGDHHTPVLKQQRRSAAASPASGASSSTSSSDDSSDGSDSDADDGEAEEEARRNIARSIETLRQAETRRMPWGPDAYKHFATNYVNSPQKIMTGRYNCKRQRPAPVLRLQELPSAQRPQTAPALAAAPASRHRSGEDEHRGEELLLQKRCCVEGRMGDEDTQVSVQMYGGAKSPSVTSEIRGASMRTNSPSPPQSATICAPRVAKAAVASSFSAEENAVPHKETTKACDGFSPAAATHETLVEVMVTPEESVVERERSPAAPGTVGKVVQGFAARQLCYEEASAETLSKPSTQRNNPVEESGPSGQLVRILSIEPCA